MLLHLDSSRDALGEATMKCIILEVCEPPGGFNYKLMKLNHLTAKEFDLLCGYCFVTCCF